MVACTPRPNIAWNIWTGTRAKPRRSDSAMMAPASGCSEPVSRLAASRSTPSASYPSAVSTDATLGLPKVTVPVLSNTTQVSLPADCSASPLRIRMPFCAARPTATMMEMGVANPKAQGQAMTSTVIAVTKA